MAVSPALVDAEPTLNKHARQTVLNEFAQKRKAVRQAELKREKARKSAVVAVGRSANTHRDVTAYYEVTAYTAGVESTGKRPGDVGYGITTSGEHVTEGLTVACPQSLAFGTRLHIEGVGYRICHDRGGAIGEGRLDVYMKSLGQAQAFGRQTLQVRILTKGSE